MVVHLHASGMDKDPLSKHDEKTGRAAGIRFNYRSVSRHRSRITHAARGEPPAVPSRPQAGAVHQTLLAR